MVIGHDLILQLGPMADFKHQVLQWDGAAVLMKEPISFPGQTDLTSRKMHDVLVQTTEPDSKIEATEIMVTIIEINYSKSGL